MAFESNIKPKILGIYDDELYLTHFESGNNGKYLMRDSLTNMHHSGGTPEAHPTLPKVVKNTTGHAYINGSFTFEWEWNPGFITETELDDYINFFNLQNTNTNYTLQKDFANNKLIGTLSDCKPLTNDWSNLQTQWVLAAPKAKCTFTSDESEVICVTRLNGSYSSYTFEQKTIEANETVEIQRPDCTVCYVLFTDHLLKTGTPTILMKNKLYKLSNPSITLTNPGTTRAKILRYFK